MSIVVALGTLEQ